MSPKHDAVMDSVNSIKERIKQLITSKGLTSARFADMIGVQRSGISHILSGRNKPSLDLLNKMLLTFPDISADWLITGQGDMLISETKKSPSTGELFPPGDEKISEKVAEPENVNREEDPPEYVTKKDTEKKTAPKVREVVTVNSPDDGKEVEKIVIFYTDRTFREYRPE